MTWDTFVDATTTLGPRPWLARALRYCTGPGHAIDLGCGSGRDTHALLLSGWTVTAVDLSAAATRATQAWAPPGAPLETVQCAFEWINWQRLRPAHLVNAAYALPFCAPHAQATVWQGITHILLPGGVFAGQFFGRDNWQPGACKLTQDALRALLSSHFETLQLDEENCDASTVEDGPQHWHVFHVVARRLG